MGQGYLDLLIEKIREDRRLLYILVVFISLLLFGWLIFNYLSQGVIDISVSGPEGESRIIVSKIDPAGKESSETIAKGTSAKVRVRSGNYKVAAEIQVPSGNTKKSLSSFKEVSVKARTTSPVQIKIEQAKVLSTQDLKDKPAFMSLKGNWLYSTTVYGVTNIYNLGNSAYTTLRKEPAYLRNVVGLCNFSNGKSIAADKQSSLYKIEGSQASEISLDEIYGEETPEFETPTHVQGTKDFVCRSDGVTFLGFVNVSSSMIASSLSSEPYDNLGDNYVTSQADESLWFFDAVNADSFDGETSSKPNFSKTLVKLSPDGTQKKTELSSYASGVSVYSSTGFCFYYQKDITCGDIETGQFKKPFKLPDNKLITNIEAVDSKRIAYSFGNRSWILNVENGQSTQLYTSDHDIIPGTMVIDRALGIISFGTQKISSEDSSYLAPIIEYGEVGL